MRANRLGAALAVVLTAALTGCGSGEPAAESTEAARSPAVAPRGR